MELAYMEAKQKREEQHQVSERNTASELFLAF